MHVSTINMLQGANVLKYVKLFKMMSYTWFIFSYTQYIVWENDVTLKTKTILRFDIVICFWHPWIRKSGFWNADCFCISVYLNCWANFIQSVFKTLFIIGQCLLDMNIPLPKTETQWNNTAVFLKMNMVNLMKFP